MSDKKKRVRNSFRESVFVRDSHKCRICGLPAVDAHHIQDRNLMPGGGYVASNGISLCSDHHLLAEVYHQTGVAHPGFSPDDLYRLIDSSLELATRDSDRLAKAES